MGNFENKQQLPYNSRNLKIKFKNEEKKDSLSSQIINQEKMDQIFSNKNLDNDQIIEKIKVKILIFYNKN